MNHVNLSTALSPTRTKEAGRCKVSGKYVPLILVSAAAACPVARHATNRWLQGFGFRIDIGALQHSHKSAILR
jgi:hypothetical protein